MVKMFKPAAKVNGKPVPVTSSLGSEKTEEVVPPAAESACSSESRPSSKSTAPPDSAEEAAGPKTDTEATEEKVEAIKEANLKTSQAQMSQKAS